MTKATLTDGPIAILLLEDNPRDADLCRRSLESSGLSFSITNVVSAADFKREVSATDYDVILGDYRLPTWTGLEAVRWLRASEYSIPFIMVTGVLGDELAVQCIKEGANDFILKNRLESLPFAILRAMEESRVSVRRDLAEHNLTESENKLSLSEHNLTQSEHKLSESENKLSQSENNLTQAESNLSQSENNLTQSESNLSQSEHNLTRSENNLSRSENNLTQSEHKLTVSEDKLSQSELELSQSEHDLRDSERQYASIVEGAPYGIFRADDSGRILMANPALTKILGYASESEVLKLNIETDVYVNAKDRGKILEKVEGKKLFPLPETKWRHKNGHTIIVLLEGRRLETGTGGMAVYETFVQDITEQRVLEQQFQQAQKMEAIGRLAGGVAHDFNNLLMIIRGCAELLDHHKANPQRVGGYLKQINDATCIAASVVQQLMAFSRKQAPEKSSIDFNAVLRDLRKMLPRLLGEDIQIAFTPGPALERACADRAQIEQILLNLAVNARDAMPTGGKLELATSNMFLNASQMESGGVELPPGHYVLLSVRDSGTGMDADVRSHIFEPFFTTKERGKGTGLGLATVYGIVRESQGFIAVDSTLGKGTTFNIYFPADEAARTEAASAAITPVAPGGSETILLVEDEAALREITCEYLQSRGYMVLSAESGMQALEICRVHDEPIDILMTDIIMPGIQGPELVKSALEMRPHIRVIYVSGYSDRGLEIVSADSSAVLLRKPYSLSDLGHTIRETAGVPRIPVTY